MYYNTDELKTIERYLLLTLEERSEITAAVAMCYPKLPELNRHEDFKSCIVAAFPEYVEYAFAVDLMVLSHTTFNFATGAHMTDLQEEQYMLLEQYTQQLQVDSLSVQAHVLLLTYLNLLEQCGLNRGYACHLLRHISFNGLDFTHIDDLADEYAEITA